MGALQDRRHALQSHAGVDGWSRQVHPLFLADLLVLHEHEVPDFDEAIALGIAGAWRPACDVLAVVIEYLRARSAGPCFAHGPEVVGGRNPNNSVVRETGNLLPQHERVVVGGIDGGHQPVPGKAELPGHEVPGKLDRHVLEVVAEREVAEHLEESVVPGRVADVVEVVVLAPGAHALLRAHRAPVAPFLESGEYILELHHAGVGEHQRRIVARHQRRGGNDLVPVLAKIVEERRADFI